MHGLISKTLLCPGSPKPLANTNLSTPPCELLLGKLRHGVGRGWEVPEVSPGPGGSRVALTKPETEMSLSQDTRRDPKLNRIRASARDLGRERGPDRVKQNQVRDECQRGNAHLSFPDTPFLI